MADDDGPVGRLRNVVGGATEGFSFLVMLGVGVALVGIGNALARLIGIGLLAILVYTAVRLVRRRAAD